MIISDITKDKIKKYEGQIPGELLADIGREYHRGMAGDDPETGELDGAILWNNKNTEIDKLDPTAEIDHFRVKSEEDAEELLELFIARIDQDNIKTTVFELDDLSPHEQSALERRGFHIEEAESRDIYVTVGDLKKLRLLMKRPAAYVKPLSDISDMQFRVGVMNSVFHERYGLLDDLPFLPKDWFDQGLSCCVVTDNAVSGLLLVHMIKPGLFRLDLLFSDKLDASLNVMNMLRFFLRAAIRHKDPGDKIIFRRHDKATSGLTGKLFPGKNGRRIKRGRR